MDDDVAIQYIEARKSLHKIETELIVIYSKLQKEVSNTIQKMKEDKPFILCIKSYKQWKKNNRLLNVILNSVTEKLLAVYCDYGEEIDDMLDISPNSQNGPAEISAKF